MNKNLRQRFTENAEQFDALMTEMLRENDYLKGALDTISSGFSDSKQEIEGYAEQILIDIENGEVHESLNEKIHKYENAFKRIIADCTARKAVIIAKNALGT